MASSVGSDLPQRPTKTLTRKQSKSQRQKDSRRKLRSAKAQAIGGDNIKHVSRLRRNDAAPIFVEYDATAAPVVSTGWHGRRDSKTLERRVYTTSEVVAMNGIAIIPWEDGYVRLPRSTAYVLNYSSVTRIIVDKDDLIIAVIRQPPRPAQNSGTSSWEQVCEEAADALRKAATVANLDQVQQTHRRGSYGQLVSGISFGGGQKVAHF